MRRRRILPRQVSHTSLTQVSHKSHTSLAQVSHKSHTSLRPRVLFAEMQVSHPHASVPMGHNPPAFRICAAGCTVCREASFTHNCSHMSPHVTTPILPICDRIPIVPSRGRRRWDGALFCHGEFFFFVTVSLSLTAPMVSRPFVAHHVFPHVTHHVFSRSSRVILL